MLNLYNEIVACEKYIRAYPRSKPSRIRYTRRGVQFHEITSTQHGNANTKPRQYNIPRIDISARMCARLHTGGSAILCRTAPAYRREMIFCPKLTEWKLAIPSATLSVKCVSVPRFCPAIRKYNNRTLLMIRTASDSRDFTHYTRGISILIFPLQLCCNLRIYKYVN